MNLVWKLLRQHISIPQFAGFAFANLFGMLIVLFGFQFYQDVLPVFTELMRLGGMEDKQAYNTFNMGIGMVLIVDAARVDAVMDELAKSGEEPVVIGKIVEGTGVVRYA